jgi:hypothetical protein
MELMIGVDKQKIIIAFGDSLLYSNFSSFYFDGFAVTIVVSVSSIGTTYPPESSCV